jgi:hypothetical protein
MPVDLERARGAKARVLSMLPKAVKVNGVGITQVGEDYAVKVNLAEAPDDGASLPKSIDGVPIVVEVVGRITKRTPVS